MNFALPDSSLSLIDCLVESEAWTKLLNLPSITTIEFQKGTKGSIVLKTLDKIDLVKFLGYNFCGLYL